MAKECRYATTNLALTIARAVVAMEQGNADVLEGLMRDAGYDEDQVTVFRFHRSMRPTTEE